MRILSYNIHKGIGGRDRRYRLERILHVIESQDADIVCLQEVDRHVPRSRYDDQPQILAHFFRAVGSAYQLNVRLKSGGYGNLVLSKWPFAEQHRVPLRLGNRKSRGAQLLVIDTPAGRLHLAHWHLGLSERERFWQANHLLGHSFFRGNGRLPTIVIGDTNDWRNTLERRTFFSHGFRHLTSPVIRFRTFPAYVPIGSLDKVFCRGTLHVERVKVVRDGLSRQASDHLPIVVDFQLSGELMDSPPPR
jgi:endonuclease/exonuclease/phosphatase family metal-dependent hydrolase